MPGNPRNVLTARAHPFRGWPVTHDVATRNSAMNASIFANCPNSVVMVSLSAAASASGSLANSALRASVSCHDPVGIVSKKSISASTRGAAIASGRAPPMECTSGDTAT